MKDVARSVAFYTTHLGFTLEHQQLPAFASVSMETGPGGKPIQVEDPDGNPIELFEPAR